MHTPLQVQMTVLYSLILKDHFSHRHFVFVNSSQCHLKYIIKLDIFNWIDIGIYSIYFDAQTTDMNIILIINLLSLIIECTYNTFSLKQNTLFDQISSISL